MALMSYKCPNCGGGLVFDPDSQKFQCEYCLSEFTEEEMKRMEEVSAPPAEEGEAVLEEEGTAPQEGGSSQAPETGEAAVYTCPSCGAQIVTDATTAASFCYYCHNPVVFSGRLSGDHMPDFVIPFAIDKKEATSRFLSWIGKKKFVPGDFFSRDQIEKLSGIYFPYLIYSCVLPPSDGVHGIKNFLTGNIDLHAHLGSQRVGALVQLFVAHIAVADIHQHDHGEHALQDALGHILDIDVQFGAQTSDLGNNAHGIVTNDGNECFHRFHPRFPFDERCRKRSGTLLLFQYSRFGKI